MTSQSGCNPQDFQYFFSVNSLYRFGSRYKRKPHSLQNITELSSLWFLLLTGAVQAQRENRQSSYVCLSARKGREAFISRDICCGGATVLLWQLSNFVSYVAATAAHFSLRDVFNQAKLFFKNGHKVCIYVYMYVCTRCFKYDRNWFVCKQAALRSSCATLREWSHNLHPPSSSG